MGCNTNSNASKKSKISKRCSMLHVFGMELIRVDRNVKKNCNDVHI